MDRRALAIITTQCEIWGDWARRGRNAGGGQSRCGSAEGRYSIPKWEADADGRGQPMTLDEIHTAERIEATVSALPMERDRLLLHAWFVERMPVSKFRGMRGIGLPAHQVRIELHRCLTTLAGSPASFRIERCC